MKKQIIIVAILFVTICMGMAQGGPSKSEREEHFREIQSMKIAYMTDFLKLTPEESVKFWPVYNQYWDAKIKISHERRTLFNRIESAESSLSDVNAMVALAQKETALIEKYGGELAKLISADKAAKTFVAEEKFKGMLLRKSQNPKR